MESIVSRRSEFEELMEAMGEELQVVAEREFQRAIDRAGISLTNELKNAFNRSVLHMAEDMSVWVEFSFNKYGRFKDVKYLEYTGGWDTVNNRGKKYNETSQWGDSELPEVVQAMIRYVKEVGLSKFKYIPGYQNSNRMPTTSRAIRRLAWTLAASRMRKGRVTNRKNRRWYNKSMGAIVNTVTPLIAERMAQMLTNGHYTRLWEGSVR